MGLRCMALSFLLGSMLTTSAHADNSARTRHPIVLAHGMAGFDHLFGVVDYFYGIASTMRAAGAEVYVTHVSSFNQTELRGEELLQQVEYIIAATGAEKVNLIGHSHGGLDVRYVAAMRPDLVASVTTVATPHGGAEIADYLSAHVTSSGFGQDVIGFFGDALGTVLQLLTGHDSPEDAIAGLDSLTTAGLADFNARFPAGLPERECDDGPSEQDGIRYFSWSGSSAMTNLIDISDPFFKLASFFSSEDSDGLVGQCRSHFGYVLRDDYRMNHADEVNQVLGLTSWFESNPKTVFKNHATRLKNLGL
jgi:triacylglycerol lipase